MHQVEYLRFVLLQQMFQRLRVFYTNEPSVTSRTKLPTKHPTISNKCKATKYRQTSIIVMNCHGTKILKYHDISWNIMTYQIYNQLYQANPPWILKCLFCLFSKTRLPKLSHNWPWSVVRLKPTWVWDLSWKSSSGGLGDVGEIPNVSPLEFEKIISKNPSKTIQTDILHKSPKLEWSALQLVDH